MRRDCRLALTLDQWHREALPGHCGRARRLHSGKSHARLRTGASRKTHDLLGSCTVAAHVLVDQPAVDSTASFVFTSTLTL
jgi:hypothetical protein